MKSKTAWLIVGIALVLTVALFYLSILSKKAIERNFTPNDSVSTYSTVNDYENNQDTFFETFSVYSVRYKQTVYPPQIDDYYYVDLISKADKAGNEVVVRVRATDADVLWSKTQSTPFDTEHIYSVAMLYATKTGSDIKTDLCEDEKCRKTVEPLKINTTTEVELADSFSGKFGNFVDVSDKAVLIIAKGERI